MIIRSTLRIIGVWMMAVVELNDMKTATVHIEVDVAFLKVGRYGFPYPDFGMHLLYSLPCRKTYASTMDMGRDKE